MLSLSVVSKVSVCNRRVKLTVRYIYGKLQSVNLVPRYPLHERTPLTFSIALCLGRNEHAQGLGEIRFKRENIRDYQAIVNLRPSVLHGEQLLRGLSLTSKFVATTQQKPEVLVCS